MADDVIETGPDALKKKRDEILLSIKPQEAPKMTDPDVYESVGETQRLNVLERERLKGDLEMKKAERESATARSLSQKYESQYKDIPEFKPTPESQQNLVGLFGLIGAIGAFGGGKSYGSALGAMNAMTGMLKGYQEGRKDLFEREKSEFDKNLQAIKAHNDQITAAFSRAKELAKTNLPMAERKLITELKAMDANVLATTLYKQGLMEADKQLVEIYNRINSQTAESLKTVAAIDKTLSGGDKFSNYRINGQVVYTSRQEALKRQQEGAEVVEVGRVPGAAGEIQFRYNSAVAGATVEGARELKNFSELPFTAQAPAAADVLTKPVDTISGAMRQYLAGTITDAEERAFQQTIKGMVRAVTNIEAGGRPGGVTEGAIRDFSGIVPKAGDARINMYLFAAMVKQEMEVAVKRLKFSRGTPEQIKEAEDMRDLADKYIPFDVSDINRVLRGATPQLIDNKVASAIKASSTLNDFERRMNDFTASVSYGEPPAGAAAAAPPPPSVQLPEQARARLKEGQITTFNNGQKWTLRDGQPVKISD